MRKLTLSEMANIAEVIGAVAVVLSLLYVGYQVRENTSEIRATNRQQLLGRAHTATQNMAASPELAAVLTKAFGGAALSPVEETQFGYVVRGLLYDIQEAYLLHREGRLDEQYWHTRAALMSFYMAVESAKDVYRRDRDLGVLHADFVRWADAAVQDGVPVE